MKWRFASVNLRTCNCIKLIGHYWCGIWLVANPPTPGDPILNLQSNDSSWLCKFSFVPELPDKLNEFQFIGDAKGEPLLPPAGVHQATVTQFSEAGIKKRAFHVAIKFLLTPMTIAC